MSALVAVRPAPIRRRYKLPDLRVCRRRSLEIERSTSDPELIELARKFLWEVKIIKASRGLLSPIEERCAQETFSRLNAKLIEQSYSATRALPRSP